MPLFPAARMLLRLMFSPRASMLKIAARSTPSTRLWLTSPSTRSSAIPSGRRGDDLALLDAEIAHIKDVHERTPAERPHSAVEDEP